MKRIAASVVAALLVLPTSAWPKLLPISLEDFLKKAPCGFLVEVTVVAEFQHADPPRTVWLKYTDRIATARVQGHIEREPGACKIPGSEIEFLFSTERHSAHPKQGEKALVFLVRNDGYFTEAVYGRSYWRIHEIDGNSYVEITWRNDPMLDSGGLLSVEETAYLPLSAIRRYWSSRTNE